MINVKLSLLKILEYEDIKLTARAAFGCADNQGDLAYIKDNEPLYLDYENLISTKK